MLHELDVALFRLINGRWTCRLGDWLAVALDKPWWLWLPLGALALYLLLKGDRRARLFVATALLAVAASDLFCAQALKPWIARLRPCVALEGVRALVGVKRSWSMPSNHAANMAAFAFVVGVYYRKWLVSAALIALVVAWSRVYVGVHYPLDVLVGAAVGCGMACPAVGIVRGVEAFFRKDEGDDAAPR
ncbi:MAG TPA: phosphatase PAP2 family protein [bacterium]|nr:phosphatase PAP2 family protein [bacterium]